MFIAVNGTLPRLSLSDAVGGGYRSGQLLHVRKKDGRRQPLKVLNLVLLQSPSMCAHTYICMYV